MLAEQIHSLQRRIAAPSLWPDMHFVDTPACALANLLGVDARRFSATPRERALLEKTQWFDHRACEFLQQHPNACVIEIGAGLSTRFHRLCARIDWPRFSWIDIDVREAIDSKVSVLPPIDNYQLLDSSVLDGNWRARTGADHSPLLIVIEDFASAITRKKFQKLLWDLAVSGRVSPVQILWDDHWLWYQNPLRQRYWRGLSLATGFADPDVIALKNNLRCLRLSR